MLMSGQHDCIKALIHLLRSFLAVILELSYRFRKALEAKTELFCFLVILSYVVDFGSRIVGW